MKQDEIQFQMKNEGAAGTDKLINKINACYQKVAKLEDLID